VVVDTDPNKGGVRLLFGRRRRSSASASPEDSTSCLSRHRGLNQNFLTASGWPFTRAASISLARKAIRQAVAGDQPTKVN